MLKNHTTVSRRDFMKALGLGAVGAGAAAAAAPAFSDLDDMLSSETSEYKRPWWVKTRNHGEPTCDVSWKDIVRMDNRLSLQNQQGWEKAVGKEEAARQTQVGNDLKASGLKSGQVGFAIRERALYEACGVNFAPISQYVQEPAKTPSPESLGVTKWQGTPEENARLLRAAFRFYGASNVMYTKLTEQEKNLIFSHFLMGGEIVWEDTDRAYEVMPDGKFVLPKNKDLYIISVATQMSKELYRHGEGMARYAANSSRYRTFRMVQGCIQGFMHTLGYQAIGYPERGWGYWGIISSIADALLTGFAEISRNNNYCISPEYGTVCGYYTILTDMPLPDNPPIDAGIFKFCHTCNKCAETCPNGAIRTDKEPTWDIPKSKLAIDPNAEPTYTTPGRKLFHTDAPACYQMWKEMTNCGRCMGTCVFNTNDSAMVHGMIKATLSTTSLFNGFLWNADKFFGYGLTPKEKWDEWWDKDYPVLGFDSTVCSFNGGY